MESILFVDDEPRILDGLMRTFRRKRDEWDMRFACSGEEALSLLAEYPATVVVTGMKMPGMDGAELLARVRTHYPETVRVILSGHAEIDLAMKAAGPSHRYLAKPCEPEALEATIRYTRSLRGVLDNPSLVKLVAQIDSLPSIPKAYQAIQQCLSQPYAALQDVGEALSADIGLTANILKFVNSAYFGAANNVTDMEHAVFMLGLDKITALVLAQGVFEQYQSVQCGSFDADDLFAYSTEVGAAVKAVAKLEQVEKNTVDEAFTAAMLHKVGKLIIASQLPQIYHDVYGDNGSQRTSSEIAERELLGATQGEIGAYLMGLWGLPESVVTAIAYHETPSRIATDSKLNAVGLVHIASRLVLNPDADDLESLEPAIDVAYIERCGLIDRWPLWAAAWPPQQGAESE